MATEIKWADGQAITADSTIRWADGQPFVYYYEEAGGEASGGSTISLWKSQRRKYQHLVVR